MKLTKLVALSFLLTPFLALPTQAESPYLKPDGSWISLSGQVKETKADTFILDYGSGEVTIEMDDWDWYHDNRELLDNENVTVYGAVDDDTYETTKIEASSVFVESLGTHFYASAADEESVEDLDVTPTIPIVVGDMTITGTITSIDGREFTIDSGLQKMAVDTSLLSSNPLDDKGFQQLDKGDLVTVSGDVDQDFFDQQELVAESVLTLSDENS